MTEAALASAEPAPTARSGDEAPRVVFLHIMKTAGSSIRTRLDEVCADVPIWRFDERGPPSAVPAAELAPYRVVMGHMTLADALHVPPPRRIFTVLRDPRDRLVSLYHFLARHRPEIAQGDEFERARLARATSLEEFLADPRPLVRDELQNMMTRVLAGGHVPVGPNTYRHPDGPAATTISGAQLLHLALGNLLALDFVTFVDRLEQDRPRLMEVLGLPDPGPFPRENTRDSVNDILEPRPVPEVTPAAEKLLNRLTDLDRMLYRLARLHAAPG
jgi:hypothetical protein